jgi:hypothetical protein
MECLRAYFDQLPATSLETLPDNVPYQQCSQYTLRENVMQPAPKLFLKFEESVGHVTRKRESLTPTQPMLLEVLHKINPDIPDGYVDFLRRSLKEYMMEETVFKHFGSKKAYLLLEILDQEFLELKPAHEHALECLVKWLCGA